MSNLSMENICRTCLRSPEKMFPLIDNSEIINRIEIISSIQVSGNDHLPSTICQECINNVNMLYNFRKVIINSHKELKERYAIVQKTILNSKHNVIEEENEDELGRNVKNELQQEDEDMDDIRDPLKSDNDKSENTKETSEAVKRAIATKKIHKCNACQLTFTSRIKLYNHRRNLHIAPGICNICGMVVRADNLKRHVQLHSEGPAKCKLCGKVFKNSESLRGHSLIHKGVTFTCEKCGKTSKVKSEHKRHMKTHVDPEIGKIMCTICGKRVRDLRKHMHSHTGERPYLCSYCSKGFTSPYALKVHTRQHTNEKPFICEYCPMAFAQKVSLTTHIKSKHYS